MEKFALIIFTVVFILLGLGALAMVIKALWPRKFDYIAFKLDQFNSEVMENTYCAEYELPGATMVLLSSTDYSRICISWDHKTGKLVVGSVEPVKFQFMISRNGKWEVLDY